MAKLFYVINNFVNITKLVINVINNVNTFKMSLKSWHLRLFVMQNIKNSCEILVLMSLISCKPSLTAQKLLRKSSLLKTLTTAA